MNVNIQSTRFTIAMLFSTRVPMTNLRQHLACVQVIQRKTAIVRPLLKKRTLEPNDPSSYRPISNLSFLSKFVEKVTDTRLSEHINRHRLLPLFQSAYCPYHSTETALVRIHNDMIATVDKGHIGVLPLLDLSAAFDTVDHVILMETLRRRFGVRGRSWLVR